MKKFILLYLGLVLFTDSQGVSQGNYVDNVHSFQKKLNDSYSDKEKSILKDGKRELFIDLGGHPFFAIDSSYRVEADFQFFSDPEHVGFETSTTRIANYKKYGEATFVLNGEEHRLSIYQSVPIMPAYKDHLFLPFTDLNSGELSYGGGRYIDLKIPDDKAKIIIDFNKSYQPYCAYTKGYSCPIPPPENFINTHINAGIQHLDLELNTLTADELIGKSVAFHDPHYKWEELQATLEFKTVMADSSERERTVTVDNKMQTFRFEGTYDEGTLQYIVEGEQGTALWNGRESVPDYIAEKYRIAPDRAIMYRNYYTYLYGMPMKIRDPGAIIEPEVKRMKFYGKTLDRVRVTYEPEVGTDTWYFYFNPSTHALEAYQFFKDESKNDGEYILFEEIKEVDGVKMPRIRHWYYNNDGKFLATDIIVE